MDLHQLANVLKVFHTGKRPLKMSFVPGPDPWIKTMEGWIAVRAPDGTNQLSLCREPVKTSQRMRKAVRADHPQLGTAVVRSRSLVATKVPDGHNMETS